MRPFYFFLIPSMTLGALAFGYVFATTGFSIVSYSIPAASMVPAVAPGEMIFASQHYYRCHTPVPGDVVLFHRSWHGALTTFIKRVIAGPGDRVQMKDGRLFVNGVMVERAPLPPLQRVPGFGADLQRYRETLSNGRSYEILEKSDREVLDEIPEIVVAPGQYFVVGDNRDASNDSRNPEFGTIASDFIDDKASIVWLSRDWHRIGMRLQPAAP